MDKSQIENCALGQAREQSGEFLEDTGLHYRSPPRWVVPGGAVCPSLVRTGAPSPTRASGAPLPLKLCPSGLFLERSPVQKSGPQTIHHPPAPEPLRTICKYVQVTKPGGPGLLLPPLPGLQDGYFSPQTCSQRWQPSPNPRPLGRPRHPRTMVRGRQRPGTQEGAQPCHLPRLLPAFLPRKTSTSGPEERGLPGRGSGGPMGRMMGPCPPAVRQSI